jgi:hypothetical protein
MAIALKPIEADLAGEPIGCQACHVIEHGTQGFAHPFQIGKRTDACEHMGGICPLFAPGFEPAALLAVL